MTDEYRPVALQLNEHESKAAKKILTALMSEFGEEQGAFIDTREWSGAAHGEVRLEGTVDGEVFEVTLRIVDMSLEPLMRDDFDEPEEDR